MCILFCLLVIRLKLIKLVNFELNNFSNQKGFFSGLFSGGHIIIR